MTSDEILLTWTDRRCPRRPLLGWRPGNAVPVIGPSHVVRVEVVVIAEIECSVGDHGVGKALSSTSNREGADLGKGGR